MDAKSSDRVETLGKRSGEEAMDIDPEVEERRKRGKMGEKGECVLVSDSLNAGLSQQLRETQ